MRHTYFLKYLCAAFLFTSLHALNCGQFGVFTQHNGHYYTTVKDRLTFEYAKTFAELGNGYLAIPNNSAENEFLAGLILGNQFAWIGIHDPSLSNNYCYETGSCSYDSSRFKTIKNQTLSFSNWGANQPDNLLKTSDVGQLSAITPLGEHWVALDSVNFKWYDFGNHNDQYNNPVKFLAIYEFDTRPECFKDDNSSELVDLHCNTAVSSTNGLTASSGQLLQCQTDENGVPFCPASLAACQNTQNTNNGYSQEHIMPTTTRNELVCPIGTNLPTDCSGSYSITWLKDMYTTLLNRCPDQAGYNYWKSEIERLGIIQQSQLQPTFCAAASRNNEPCGSASPSSTTCYGTTLQNTTVQQPVTTTNAMACSSGVLNPDMTTCNGTCTSSNYSCPSGGTLSGSTCIKTCTSSNYSCPSGGTLSGSTCTVSSSITPYKASCPSGSILATDGGAGTCMKSVPSTTTCPSGFSRKTGFTDWCFTSPTCPSGGLPVVMTYNNFNSVYCTGTSSSSYNATLATTNYDCSYTASGTSTTYACTYAASCPTGTNLPSQCTGSYPNTWLKGMYTGLLSRCPDQAGYNHWLNYISANGITEQSQLQPTFCAAAARNNEPCGSATPSATTCYGTSLQNVTVQQPVTTTNAMACPTGTNLPSQCTGSYPNTWLKGMYTGLLSRCPDQAGYNHWLNYISANGITEQSQLQPTFCAAAARNNEPCGSATPSATTCYGTEMTNYYTYHCDANTNVYGEAFVPQNAGGESSTSPTPPTNNCVQQNYICNANPDQTCANVGGVWQCSEHPCVDANDMEHTDTEVGSQDGDDDGWNQSTGACEGQLYLFGGTSGACRSWDLFGNFVTGTAVVGTAGIVAALDDSNCCSDDAVLFGLISCRAEEKLLAEKKKAGNCHYIGEFCSRRINLGFTRICVQKKKSSCCFNSKLAKIINEQGRPQLDMGWGSASNPTCRGFTPEEFQKLDMSRIDFSEFLEDFEAIDMSNIGSSIANRVNNNLNAAFPQPQ